MRLGRLHFYDEMWSDHRCPLGCQASKEARVSGQHDLLLITVDIAVHTMLLFFFLLHIRSAFAAAHVCTYINVCIYLATLAKPVIFTFSLSPLLFPLS